MLRASAKASSVMEQAAGERENWASRLGFVMAAAGSAVGLGNIWRFPWLAGENGGGLFLLVYLLMVGTLGISVLLAEIVIGRAAQKDPVGAFRLLGGGAWPLVGYLGITSAFLILSFYGVVAGWVLAFAVKQAGGLFATVAPPQAFSNLLGATFEPLAWAFAFLAMTAAVVTGGIRNGIERANLVLMPLLFLLLVLLAVRAVTLPGGFDGLRFFLAPDVTRLTTGTFAAALGQAFFSLSIGLGAMITYGSYLQRHQPMGSAALQIAALDTMAAVLAGCIVFPAVSFAGLDPASGPSLAFVTLPTVFAEMPAGRLFGVVFFVLLAIAALTSAISLLEPVVAFLVDEHGFRRRPATLLVAVGAFLLGVPSSLSQGAMPELAAFGMSFLDLIDFLTASLMLPAGGFAIALFVGWKIAPLAAAELADEAGHIPALTRPWILFLRFAAPAAIAWILLAELIG
jgi:NSS family neurotransmitter:Na+ symporter